MWLLFAQLAATPAPDAPPPPGPGALPDIEFRADVRARELAIEQQGRASARLHGEPSGGERIEVERNLPKGQARYRNLDLSVRIDARLADASRDSAPAPATDAEPTTQQGD